MKTQLAYCSACDQQVRITVTPAPLHGGHASLPDSEVVCLDFGEKCTGSMCPMFGLPSILMGVRLARSGLHHKEWSTVDALCEGCGRVMPLEVLGPDTAYCEVCGTTNRLVIMKLDDDSAVAITVPAAEKTEVTAEKGSEHNGDPEC